MSESNHVSDNQASEPAVASSASSASAASRSGSGAAASPSHDGWERSTLEKLLMAQIDEQRRNRRWQLIRRALTIVFFGWLAWLIFSAGPGFQAPVEVTGRHTALVSVVGLIEPEGEVDAYVVNEALRAAVEASESAGVVLRMNSPGGSPVQSSLIFNEIRRMKALYPEKPILAVVEDVCASGGYYIASATDAIYVNQSSLIGSIGVRLDSFGFTEALKKLGIERRLITAGENKAMLDPFLPEKPEHKRITQVMLQEVHEQFIAAVKEGRGDRLANDPDIFSGMVYTGARGVDLGLADGYGSVESVAREVIKAETIIDYSYAPSVAERLAKQFGAGMGEVVLTTLRAASMGLVPSP